MQRPNLLVMGASGGVATALLQLLEKERALIGNLVLLDRNDVLRRNPFLRHEDLRYAFIQAFIDVRRDSETYHELLRSRKIDIAVDLTTNETEPMLAATDVLGVSYVNTGIMNPRNVRFVDVVLRLHARKTRPWNAPHILCAGMNPGVVNLWVRQAIERFGIPRGIVHFEYDSGQPASGWGPVIAWSLETFLDEIVNDPAGYMEGRDRLRLLYPNPIKHRLDMKEILTPIIRMQEYPRGFLLLHEENITLSQTYDVPSRFLFALHPHTMDYLEHLYDREQGIPSGAMILGDNFEIPLTGAATVGVRLEYGDREVYLYNTTLQDGPPGCSGSCRQVAAGIRAALLTLMEGHLERRVHFVEDLFGTPYGHFVNENLVTEERITLRQEVEP